MVDTLLADSEELIAREESRCYSIDQPADHMRVIKDGHTFGAVLTLFLAWITGSRFRPGHTSNGWGEVACEDEGGRQYCSVSLFWETLFESHTNTVVCLDRALDMFPDQPARLAKGRVCKDAGEIRYKSCT